MTIPHNHVAIIGTGFDGIAAGVRPQKAGVGDPVLSTAPGTSVTCGGITTTRVRQSTCRATSTPSRSPRTRTGGSTFAKRPELDAYLRRATDRFDLRRRLELDCTVEALRWEPTEQRWTLETSRGRRTAQHVVVATGALAEPVIPDLPGLEAFEGARFHSARWDHGFDLTGRRVAVISSAGHGADADSFVPSGPRTEGLMG
jgi:cation diffusion facilitator CzcD-associated flavoprotein CzcO